MTITDKRLREWEEALGMRKHLLGEMGSLIQLQLLDGTEIRFTKDDFRALIAAYRGYRNCIANIEHAQASGMVSCRLDIVKDTLEIFQKEPKS